MSFKIEPFSFLSSRQLFEIYKLRASVFVVEQNCAYQDIDEKDLGAQHVFMAQKEEIIAYARILPPGVSYPEPSIGRVCVRMLNRKSGLGRSLMKYCIQQALQLYKNQDIVISAQLYLLSFYESFGFVSEGKDYLEDDIPHIQMRLKSL